MNASHNVSAYRHKHKENQYYQSKLSLNSWLNTTFFLTLHSYLTLRLK